MAEKTVMTVRGPVPASKLGITLMHDHIFGDMTKEFRIDGLLNDVPAAIRELGYFYAEGGRTVVDVTSIPANRYPKALQYVSEATGLNIVLGCGLYRHQYFDSDWVDRTSTNELADWIVRDLTEGVGGTDIKAGIIGEIACDQWMTAQEERSFRAAARAHKKTGVVITTHAARWPIGGMQLDLLAEEGVDPHRVVIGHADTVTSVEWRSEGEVLKYHETLAKRGAFVQFDTIAGLGRTSDNELQMRVRYVQNLVAEGFSRQILLSHDLAFRSMYRANGGGGYSFILTNFVPLLKAAGISDETIHTILVDNPRRAFTGE